MLLFERNGLRVTLTGAGEEMLKEGHWLLSAASDLESRMRQIATGYESELRLSDRTVGLLARQPHITVPSMAAKIACQVAGRATAFCRTAS